MVTYNQEAGMRTAKDPTQNINNNRSLQSPLFQDYEIGLMSVQDYITAGASHTEIGLEMAVTIQV